MNPDFAFAKTRRFAPLFGTQFLGAFNDNFFKTVLFVLITYHGLGQNTVLPPAQLLNIGALLFILPYFLFSAVSGEISTRFDKGIIARLAKILEIAIMALAACGFVIESLPLLLFCLFLMGTQSTLFGPLKYAILPDYLSEKELIMGNGLIESGTFVAILLGQFTGSVMAGVGEIWIFSLALLVAAAGCVFSFNMPRVPAKNPQQPVHLNIVRSSKNLLRQAYAQKDLWAAVIGISWFWFIGSVYITQLPTFTTLHLGGNQYVLNLMLTLFSVSIGAGSVFCAKISRGRLNLRLVVYGALAMTFLGIILALTVYRPQNTDTQTLYGIVQFFRQPFAYTVTGCMLFLGFFGGFFSVPLYTWLQTSCDDTFRAHAVAANNIVNGVFMVAAALISAVLLWLIHNVALLYLLTALGNIVLIAVLMKISPKFRRGG